MPIASGLPVAARWSPITPFNAAIMASRAGVDSCRPAIAATRASVKSTPLVAVPPVTAYSTVTGSSEIPESETPNTGDTDSSPLDVDVSNWTTGVFRNS